MTKEIYNKQILNRVNDFLLHEEVPVTLMCRKVFISPQTFYLWRKDSRALSENVLKRFDNYLKHLNY